MKYVMKNVDYNFYFTTIDKRMFQSIGLCADSTNLVSRGADDIPISAKVGWTATHNASQVYVTG